LASLKAYVLELDDGMVDAALIIFVTFLFVFGFPIVFLIVYFLKVHKPLEQARIQTPQQVIVKEVVMVPCEYCGGLMPTTATQCPSCKAPRKS
jgi:hypothetical protein